MSEMRLNQYLARCGVCSRRQADKAVEEGRVLVNGRPAELGMRIGEGDEVLYNGSPVMQEERRIILAVNKPAGIVCTTAEFKGEQNIVDMVNYGKRIYPIGRLDKNSEGLILMTNDGDLADRIARGANHHEKEYEVEVDRLVTAEFLEAMASGVEIEFEERGILKRVMTRPCKVKKLSRNTFSIILTQGLNRQIRRMCETRGFRVRHLKRVRVMSILLGDLQSGGWRELTDGEVKSLEQLL